MSPLQARLTPCWGPVPAAPALERSDLLEPTRHLSVQGKALNDHASRNVKVLVVGNPANTNCLIAQRNAPGLDPRNFTAMTRLDHNRAVGQLAAKTGCSVSEISGLAIWGNHSTTMYPDISHASAGGRVALGLVESDWVEAEFLNRAEARRRIIAARASSAHPPNAASATCANWALGNPTWSSMGVYSTALGIAEGFDLSFPVTCSGGDWRLVEDLGHRSVQPEKLLRRSRVDRRAGAVAHSAP